MRIFCVIPALNEEKYIAEAVAKVKLLAEEVVVVDDGSTDLTAQLAEAAGATVLRHLINSGQGASLETGNQYALKNGADIIFHFDADGQFSVDDIPEVLAPLFAGEAEAVLGSRFLGKESNMPPFKKKVIMPIARLVNRLLLGVKLTDPQSGFRAMTAAAWRKIPINQKGMAHASEILYKIVKNKIKIKEVPIKVTYHDFGQKFSGGIRIIKDIILAKLMD
ncbi:MAG: glycosyltransferase family 2 protein [Patescibacteria group bacterium]|nr:glycosyltransferase family 2 protein [Patescibacteria group bacterium]